MAFSKPVVPSVIQNVPVLSPHYLVCTTDDCENNCQFYCNQCYKPMCEQCRDEHQMRPDTTKHIVVRFNQQKRKLPIEKCKDHPTKDIDMICNNCQVAICSKCAIQNHRGHIFDDLETIYSEKFQFFLDRVYKIHQDFLPTSQNMQKDIAEDVQKMKTFMDEIRISMKTEAKSLKHLVDEVISEKIKHVNKMEESILEELQNQNKTYEEYNISLGYRVQSFNCIMSSNGVEYNPVILCPLDRMEIKPVPETTKPVYPEYIAGKYNKNDVTNLLGRLRDPNTKPETRKIKTTETKFTELKTCWKSNETEDRKFCCETNTVAFFICHIYLIGNKLHEIQTSGEDESGGGGFHIVTQDGSLIIAEQDDNVINKITMDNTITEFIQTGNWEPLSIHSSCITGDIVVGMVMDGEAKVTMYNKIGEEIQNIQWNDQGQKLYSYPHYITENINGDICVSDNNLSAVVVVNKSGQYRFSYTGQESMGFDPYGICTDILGHILVCDSYNKAVHLFDQNGQFLSLLVTEEHGLFDPLSVCVWMMRTIFMLDNAI
ncbi:E3 ubiquitin-protein ligase TRIM71-like [Magallana gigas]|uniref:E3 ubiquitin-protein ligase TRIM71-like n=1 Tax=Magallana gigas TaxID=29159 RepID=UPI0033428F46